MSQTPLIQLVTTGIKDEYLSLNPDISYFKYVYKRHTRFAIHSLKNEFNTKPLLSSEDQKCMINIQRHGDLLADINLHDPPNPVARQQAERSDPAHGERGLHRAEAGDHDQRRAQPHGLGSQSRGAAKSRGKEDRRQERRKSRKKRLN